MIPHIIQSLVGPHCVTTIFELHYCTVCILDQQSMALCSGNPLWGQNIWLGTAMCFVQDVSTKAIEGGVNPSTLAWQKVAV